MSSVSMQLPGPDSELMQLVNAACEGTATLADGRRLETLLADQSNRAFYLAATEVHAALAWRWQSQGAVAHNGLSAALPGAAQAGFQAAPWMARAAIVALGSRVIGWLRQLGKPVPFACLVSFVLVGGLLVAVSQTRLDSQLDGFGTAATQVVSGARVLGLHDVAWTKGARRWNAWETVRPGDILSLSSGLVHIRHECGGTVVIEGPAIYTLLGGSSGRLDSGRVVARIEHESEAPADGKPLFSIFTPRGEVHDLGTEFGVEVDGRDAMAVHVFTGLVELATVDPHGSAEPSTVRLAAGASAKVDASGVSTRGASDVSKRFVRNMPAPSAPAETLLEQIGWDEKAAHTIYQDRFLGDGSLAGSTPASRGGVGSDPWIAPASGWTIQANRGRLLIDREGSAFLPFTPRAGRLYRLTVKGEILAGGIDQWFAFGFTQSANPGKILQKSGSYARMLQRQDTASKPNCVCFLPEPAKLWQSIDSHPGPAFVRSIILDTRDARWTAWFFLGDTLLCQHAYDRTLDDIGYIAISTLGKAKARVREVTVAECSHAPPSRVSPGGR